MKNFSLRVHVKRFFVKDKSNRGDDHVPWKSLVTFTEIRCETRYCSCRKGNERFRRKQNDSPDKFMNVV